MEMMEMMTLDQLAGYLRRDAREVSKLAQRGKLPGQKVSGEWRFSRTEINHWLEEQLPSYTDQELIALETEPSETKRDDLLISSLLDLEYMAVPLPARTSPSVVRELVELANAHWLVYDPEALVEAVTKREELVSTAYPNGVAIPHPHRPLPNVVGQSLIAYGRTYSGIPFGAERGGLTDIFFLVCCQSSKTHMQVMARLSRLLLRPDFIDSLREAETPADTLRVIREAETELLGTV